VTISIASPFSSVCSFDTARAKVVKESSRFARCTEQHHTIRRNALKKKQPFALPRLACPNSFKLPALTDLTPDRLKEDDVKLLFLDWDNTFSSSHKLAPHVRHERWLDRLLTAGIKVVVLSNDFKYRRDIKAFCYSKGIKHIHNAQKPLAWKHFVKAFQEEGVKFKNIALVDENLAQGLGQSVLAQGIIHYWPPPLNPKDPLEHWFFCKALRFASRLALGWMAQPFLNESPLVRQDKADLFKARR
jgi:HAD superfamily phosphatase (TIGR01668 family)